MTDILNVVKMTAHSQTSNKSSTIEYPFISTRMGGVPKCKVVSIDQDVEEAGTTAGRT